MKIMSSLFIILCFWNILIVLNKKKYRKIYVPNKIKIFNLGSSHGLCSFNYTEIKEKYKIEGYNFGWHSQTFYYDYIVLKNYFKKISEGGLCFIPISYFSFYDKKCWNKNEMRYKKTLKFYNLEGNDKIEAILYQYFPIYISIRKKIKKYILKNNKYYILKEGAERIKKHVEILESQNEQNNIKILEKIIKLLKTKNIEIILITTPFHKEYNKFFSKELLNNKFYKVIYKVKNQYNLKYLDFSHNYDTFNKEEYFNDFDHLSKEGSKIFMKELMKELKKEGINL